MTSRNWEGERVKIATWNIERLKHKRELKQMTEICESIAADVFVLTESDSKLSLNYTSCLRTSPPTSSIPDYYEGTEYRAEIYTNCKIIKQYETFDEQTALCAELLTDHGNLLLYGVVIGIYGNRHKNFTDDLPRILADIARLASGDQQLCVCGDFNCTFADNYYYTKAARAALADTFKRNNLELLTRNLPECIDHIAVSKKFIGASDVGIGEWNHDKKLSDHKGVWVKWL
jgi:endonuclease/exonuclease/phosphatase family metal-dependent hydrolase